VLAHASSMEREADGLYVWVLIEVTLNKIFQLQKKKKKKEKKKKEVILKLKEKRKRRSQKEG